MDHFKQQDWVDFVRGTLDPGHTATIEAHLVDGCQTCSATLSGWQAIASIASRVRRPGPPEGAVRSVKAAYFLERTPHLHPETVQFATMLFDSFLSPLPVGVRAASPGVRHWIYQSGNCTIEFQVGCGLEANQAFLAGQIADSSQPIEALGASKIKLVRNGHVAAQTTANTLGEFTLEFTNDVSLWLLVESPERAPIAVCIPDLIT